MRREVAKEWVAIPFEVGQVSTIVVILGSRIKNKKKGRNPF